MTTEKKICAEFLPITDLFLANNDKHTSFLTYFHENWEIFVLTPIIVVISLLKLISHLWFIWRFYLKRGQLKGSVHLHLKWIKWREFYNDNSLKEGVHCLLYHNKLPIKRFLKCISNHPDAFLLLFILFSFLFFIYVYLYIQTFLFNLSGETTLVSLFGAPLSEHLPHRWQLCVNVFHCYARVNLWMFKTQKFL